MRRYSADGGFRRLGAQRGPWPRLKGGAAAGDDGPGSNAFDEDFETAGSVILGFIVAVQWIASGDTVLEVLGVGMLLMLAASWYRHVVERREFVRSIHEFDETTVLKAAEHVRKTAAPYMTKPKSSA